MVLERMRGIGEEEAAASRREGGSRTDEYLDSIGATEADRKVFKVWNDDELRACWMSVLIKHGQLLTKLGRKFGRLRDLPAEMSGSSAHVLLDDEGEIAYRFESTLTGTIQRAVAELVHDHGDKITEAMITNRVNARLMDEIRKSDEFERAEDVIVPIPEQPVTITGADGSTRIERPRREPKVKRVTRRKQLPTRRYRRKDVAGDRAIATLDRRTLIESLEGYEQMVVFVFLMVRLHSTTLSKLWRSLSPGSRRFRATDWKPFAADGPGGALAAVHRFFEPLLRDDEVDGLLRSALERIGEELPEELPEELLDDGGEEASDEEGERMVGHLLGTGAE